MSKLKSLPMTYDFYKVKSDKPIEVMNYTKKFGSFLATKNISFSLNKGVIHGFIGPNGSGKTTTIKAIIGAYIPTKGKINVGDHKAGSIQANKLIGYIPERASFPKHLNCIQYLTTMGELSGLESKQAKLKAKEILVDLKMIKHAKRKPVGFSSGMQKKILLAQSLLTDPKILILDEPAANLDPSARKELFDHLITLRNQGKTILISSHILAELERLIDEVTFVYYGEVIYTGKISNIEALSQTDIFIKSENNKMLSEILKKEGYEVSGDLKTEIIIKNIQKSDSQKAMDAVVKTGIEIKSYRANDLQSIYDALVSKAKNKGMGSQELKGKKIFSDNDEVNIQGKGVE